jgi:hypothetical protein
MPKDNPALNETADNTVRGPDGKPLGANYIQIGGEVFRKPHPHSPRLFIDGAAPPPWTRRVDNRPVNKDAIPVVGTETGWCK